MKIKDGKDNIPQAIMITGRNKALFVLCILCIFLMLLFAGCAKEHQTKAEIKASNPYMTEAINEAL